MKGRNILGAFILGAGMFFATSITAKADGNTITVGVDAPTINEAIMKAAPGDTVSVPSGVYHEKLIITNPNIRIIGEKEVVLDGFVPDEDEAAKANPRQNDIVPTAEEPAMVDIRADGVVFQNIDIRNYYLDEPDLERAPKGIIVREGTKKIDIYECKIYDMGCNYQLAKEQGEDLSDFEANGILICGDSIEDGQNYRAFVRDCELYNLQLGGGEAISITGNDIRSYIERSKIHDIDNTGVGVAGYETVDYSTIKPDRKAFITYNDIYNISSINNPTINEPSAAGVYVNDACGVSISSNSIKYCDLGIEIDSNRIAQPDSDLSVRYITVSNNVLYKNNAIAGISFGGYSLDSAGVNDCTFNHNTVYNTSGNCFLIQNATDSSNSITANLFLAQRNANAYSEVFPDQSKAFSIVGNKSNIGVEKEGIDQWDIKKIVWRGLGHYQMYVYADTRYLCGSPSTHVLKYNGENMGYTIGVDPLADEPEENVSGEEDEPDEPVEGGEEIVELEPVDGDGEIEEVPEDVVLPDEPEENVGGEEDKVVELVEGGEETVEVAPVEEEQPVVNENPKIIGFRSRFGR